MIKSDPYTTAELYAMTLIAALETTRKTIVPSPREATTRVCATITSQFSIPDKSLLHGNTDDIDAKCHATCREMVAKLDAMPGDTVFFLDGTHTGPGLGATTLRSFKEDIRTRVVMGYNGLDQCLEVHLTIEVDVT